MELAVELGVASARLTDVMRLSGGDKHTLYRLAFDNRPAILKLFHQYSVEIELYRLFARIGVVTPVVLKSTRSALLIEDLSAGNGRRLASPDDVTDSQVMEQIAAWYRTLHTAAARHVPKNIPHDYDNLNVAAVWRLGAALDLQQRPVWQLATDSVDGLISAIRKLPETLIYNDFHYSNLAIRPGAAMMFDYDHMIVGPAASDCRNVVNSLGPAPVESFLRSYGPIDDRAATLDSPIATLAALQRAITRPQLPPWAK